MTTKDELSLKLNDLLMLPEEVDFTGLTKSEIERLLDFISKPKNLLEITKRAMRGRVQDDFMNMKVKDILEPSEIGEGPFGLGIIPKIRDRVKMAN